MSDTTMFQRPNLQDLVKEAMEGTVQRVDINLEAARQMAGLFELPAEKTKQAAAQPEITPTSYISKLAGALDYLSKQAAEGSNDLGPGKGPNALGVMAATSSEENIDAGQSGQAIAADVPPKDPPQQSSGVAKDPANAMQTNDSMMHGEQPVDPMGNEKTSAIYRKNLEKLGFSITQDGHGVDARVLRMREQTGLQRMKQLQDEGIAGYNNPETGGSVTGSLRKALTTPFGGIMDDDPRHMAYAAGQHEMGSNAWNPFGGALTPHPMEQGGTALQYGKITGTKPGGPTKKEKSKEKKSSVLAKNLAALGLSKLAEDAINPAKIAAGSTQTGATPPEGATPSEEGVPSEPGDVTSQKRMVDSNDAAINYTKGQAKADPKKDVGKLLQEPPLSAAHDSTLQKTLDHTSQAGVKISHDLTKTAAAQALLYKLAEEACGDKKDTKKKKEKDSQMAGLSNPSGQSGFSASSMGM